ncbi:MAG TPA: ATP-binding protein [Thermoanaerobaculia bacterium]
MNGLQVLPRLVSQPLALALRSFPVVVITGSRQTGKSTLVRLSDERAYLTLDDLEILDRARREPEALVRSAGRMTLDEVQRSPDLLLAVKRAVDEHKVPGRFLLTGSANLLLMQRISESLAGRAAYLTLWPLTRREQLGAGTAGVWTRLFEAEDESWPDLLAGEDGEPEDWRDLARRGGYPIPAHELQEPEARALWFDGYTRTYLERDLQELSTVTSLVDFRRLMRAACLRLGNLVQQTELGRDVGLPQPTVHRHLALLETSYQLVRVPAYSVNRTKRLLKTPKLYWCDTGLALHLSGETEPRGAHLENMILTDLLAWRDSLIPRPEILFWRTAAGEEVDFLIEWQGQLLPVEVKATAQPRLSDARGLLAFRAEYPDLTRAGLLLHTGTEMGWIAQGVLAAPWWRVI